MNINTNPTCAFSFASFSDDYITITPDSKLFPSQTKLGEMEQTCSLKILLLLSLGLLLVFSSASAASAFTSRSFKLINKDPSQLNFLAEQEIRREGKVFDVEEEGGQQQVHEEGRRMKLLEYTVEDYPGTGANHNHDPPESPGSQQP
ncbi:hypothetical protein RJ641_003630 [Dillenia turbinata]|uniref:Uncharacterized protein n=1 Tax=Dillenia turbinata TaxID=194707 RepID=A0AAN8VLS9_9MAGN